MMKAALVGCSNPLKAAYRPVVDQLVKILEDRGLEVVVSQFLTDDTLIGRGEKRARELESFFLDPEMGHIFDISGGDLANTVLGHLDLEQIKDSQAVFYGYSDLTTILTALAKNGNQAVNFQLSNCLVNKDLLKSGYFDRLLAGKEKNKELDELEVTFVRGSKMAGPVYGGNLRCLLKLAGTPDWPDFTGSILLLEAYRGQPELVASLLEQCREIGIFNQISGVLLGTFSELDKLKESQLPEEILLDLLPTNLPIAKTEFIGHRPDAKAIRLGQECVFKEVGV
ncbi:LD-carboxypeptidase [Lactobacillus delbrueckii]|uniref:LD-carboxypeptidase n=1 Tax=Lactobacillus delbrueckii TaxID=1584 RepID=UPI000230E66B|nr:LD-carboxypeptidase [Lactobacillus delbrueckii]EHE88800.1 Muramoyltetrapeptide carboxypeptidase [Lactobacillus delbrueckii subsp. bulgaricus CNCM I-1632]MBS4915501.1 LD-carboxypeptidase [Lactobacillus delbrueckii]MCD5465752.1 LD-carboxypeptidase [Lactobacillus delbrueckii subsp. bulgaricus]MCT3468720.1 LD-carboxypeptidase [Lactobacillus delbrueckii subsp. bulgaricus]MCT3474047.1 LD-carboxypeptidase [Lactobacillus delbrueckii subsp. bulgaricus]